MKHAREYAANAKPADMDVLVRNHAELVNRIAYHLAGRLPAERLVTSRIDLDGIEDAFAAMRRGDGVRAVVGF